MKFIIKKGTKTFELLSELHQKIVAVEKEAQALALELGFEKYASKRNTLAGGIGAFYSDKKPENFKTLQYGWYYPKICKATQELRDKINNLPTISNDEINAIVNFKHEFIGLTLCYRPGVIFGKDYHLMAVNDQSEYIPNEDIQEITVSEYKRLAQEIKDSVNFSNHI